MLAMLSAERISNRCVSIDSFTGSVIIQGDIEITAAGNGSPRVGSSRILSVIVSTAFPPADSPPGVGK